MQKTSLPYLLKANSYVFILLLFLLLYDSRMITALIFFS
jgi:hypothetical protein